MATSALPTYDPFFILYDARSGSTFLANQLMHRYRVGITPETEFVPLLIEYYSSMTVGTDRELAQAIEISFWDPKFSDLGLDKGALTDALRKNLPLSLSAFIFRILAIYGERNVPDATRYGIKKGSYVYQLASLQRLFPQAQFICVIRDGRAVFHSKKHSRYSRTGRPFATDPAEAAAMWKERVALMRELEQSCDKCFVIRYEELIVDTERCVNAIAKFLGVDQCRDRHGTYLVNERYGVDLHRNADREPLQERLNAWADGLSPQEIEAYELVAGDELEREGYSLVFPHDTRAPVADHAFRDK
jgi:hypothetical protein